MFTEFEIPLVCLIFVTILNIVYFNKERVNYVENKYYNIILTSTFFVNLINTIVHIICSVLDFDVLVYQYGALIRFFNQIGVSLIILSCLSLTAYTLVITYKKARENVKVINAIIISLTIISFLITFFLDFELVKLQYVTSGTGPLVSFSYLIIAVIFSAALLINIINFKKLDRRHSVIFLILIMAGLLGAITFIYPEFNIYDLILALLCYIMFFTIENPDVKINEELRIAKQEAERANTAKSEFLASMSHEIRTPLNAIVGFSSAIQDTPMLPPTVVEYANDIVDSSDTLLDIIGGILDISKIESNKLEILEAPYIAEEEFSSAIRLIKTKLIDKNIALNVSIAPDIPYELIGDKVNVKKVLTNILSNAVKYTNEGTINVTIRCINKNNYSYLMISVQDTGIGIKAEKITRLFNKFERLDIEKDTTTEGTGLGLAITKRLLELMGGNINVKSQYGVGSIFVIHLPQKISRMNAPVDELEALNTKEMEEERLKDIGKYRDKKVLIVDDNKLNIKVAKISLEPFGFQIDEVISGDDCLKAVKETNYDLILMDIMMPGLSGEETLKILKEDPSFTTPVVALTADAISGSKDKYLSYGFTDYIAKPFTKDEIKTVIDKTFKE